MTKAANTTLRFGSGVDKSVKDALARDPEFVHPEFVDRTAWVIRDGRPREARIVGAVRRGGPDYTIVAFDVLADGEAVVIQTHWTEVFWSQEDAALAQSELGEAPDL